MWQFPRPWSGSLCRGKMSSTICTITLICLFNVTYNKCLSGLPKSHNNCGINSSLQHTAFAFLILTLLLQSVALFQGGHWSFWLDLFFYRNMHRQQSRNAAKVNLVWSTWLNGDCRRKLTSNSKDRQRRRCWEINNSSQVVNQHATINHTRQCPPSSSRVRTVIRNLEGDLSVCSEKAELINEMTGGKQGRPGEGQSAGDSLQGLWGRWVVVLPVNTQIKEKKTR